MFGIPEGITQECKKKISEMLPLIYHYWKCRCKMCSCLGSALTNFLCELIYSTAV